MPSYATLAQPYWGGMLAVAMLVCAESAVLAQTLSPVQRTPQEEKEFVERQSRRIKAGSALEECMKKEVERDFAMKYVGVSAAVNDAINACSTLLERYAFADCVAGYTKNGEKACSEPGMRAASIKVDRERQMETWVPVLLKRRVELQPDGPRYLYDFASQLVYAVVAKNERGNTTAQGVAVPLEDRYLATNCHVVEKAKRITIHVGKTQIGARHLPPLMGGPDRCLLYADEQLPAFAAIRQWRDLNVGERMYAIWVPQDFALGVSLTLTDGILSGKRTDGKHRLVQTTAPISQGSSGGGLFDSSGRLVGITTLPLTSGQGLNSAIAAEDWRWELCHVIRGFGGGPRPDCSGHKPLP